MVVVRVVTRGLIQGPNNHPAAMIRTSDSVKMIVDVSASTESMTTQERVVIYISDVVSLPILHFGSIDRSYGRDHTTPAKVQLSVTYPTKRDNVHHE